MIPVMIQTWGGGLVYIEGRSARHFGFRLRSSSTFSSAETVTSPRHPGHFLNESSNDDYFQSFFNGANSYFPGAAYNHRSLAVYEGRVYQANNRIRNNVAHLFITRFDGSGLFINRGDSEYEARPDLNGRGFEFMSPSGVNIDNTGLETETNDCALLVHEGTLFFMGQIHQKDNLASDAWTQNNWDYDLTALAVANDRSVRQYFWATIDSQGRKTFGPATRFTQGFAANAPSPDLTHMCDAISFDRDIYFCNPVDVVRIQGGSGSMTLMDTDTSRPTTRALEIWPSGGFSNGIAQGTSRLLLLEGSGILKSVKFGSQYPSGVDIFADFASLVTSPGLGQTADIRTTDPWRARLTSATDEPMRGCALKNFNNQLHAFIPTQTSGYHHLINNGLNASGIANWSDASRSLPDDIGRFDGNIFVAEDPVRKRMLVSFISMSNIGVMGHPAQKTGGGGTYLFSYNQAGEWENLYFGAAGGTPRGLAPLLNLGPFITIPSGNNPEIMKCDDYAVMDYTLTDEDARPVNVTPEFSINEGVSWNIARRFSSYNGGVPLGSGTTNLATSPTGVEYTFFWDFVNDVGFSKVENALLRMTPRLRR